MNWMGELRKYLHTKIGSRSTNAALGQARLVIALAGSTEKRVET